MGVGGQHHAPAALPPGKNRYPLYRGLGGPQGRSGRVRKISPPPGFDHRTVQPVANRYTDCAIPAPALKINNIKIDSHLHLMNTIGSELRKFAKNSSDKRHYSNGVPLATLVQRLQFDTNVMACT